MQEHTVVSREDWIAARKKLLAEEKALTRARDRLSQQRRELPWVRIDKPYRFDSPEGRRTLGELFAGRSQLVVYHFMFDPSWEVGCKSCSFWADNFDGIVVHLNQRDVSFVAASRAPLSRIEPFKRRMGWRFPWVSSAPSDFNYDYRVSFTPEERARGDIDYNYGPQQIKDPERPGISVFYKNGAGEIFHTYSCYARGLDMMNTAYHYLDLVPKGRDEDGLPHFSAWLRLHDSYGQ